jgi:soluble lytic murein transglycosylase-like protein
MPELWQWEQEAPRAMPPSGPQFVAAALRELDGSKAARLPRHVARLADGRRRSARLAAVAALVVVLGTAVALAPEALAGSPAARLRALEAALRAREGELNNSQLAAERLRQIMAHSTRYRIPADLATAIFDIATAEGIDPPLAFALVRVESHFVSNAVSAAGAVGLTQVLPSTAGELEPGVAYVQLLDRDTNLRIGFRYLRKLLDQYDGDTRTALLAYNRGPTRVDAIRSRGQDPGNGYARDVMTRARAQ